MAKEQQQPDPETIAATRGQQHTGNHDKPGPERGGSDRHGGTRHGAENVESAKAGDQPGAAHHTEEQSARRKAAERAAGGESFD